jgi:hypothetical protein
MAKIQSETGPVIPLLRDDGTVYFEAPKPLDERLCEWALSVLWFLMLAVIVATLVWG